MKKKRKKIVTLAFKREELLYDIKNVAFVEGDVMRTENEHERHQVIDIGEDGNIDRVTRMLDLAFARCVELCYPYSKEPTWPETIMDDVLNETETYVMRMRVPVDYSQTTVTLLERLIHELLVSRVLWDWMSITNRDAAAAWFQKMNDLEEQIKDALNAHIGRVRLTLTPF